MADLKFYFPDDEALLIKAKPKGWVREIIRAALAQQSEAQDGDTHYDVFLPPDLAEYCDSKGGAKWLAKVVEVNLALSKSTFGEQMGWGWTCPGCKGHVKKGEPCPKCATLET